MFHANAVVNNHMMRSVIKGKSFIDKQTRAILTFPGPFHLEAIVAEGHFDQ